jgi:hypothetical protein
MKGLESLLFICTNAGHREKDSAVSSTENHQLFIDESLCNRIVGALLKQLSEKLDSVRNEAGSCLERILTSEDPFVPFISNRSLLIEALNLGEKHGTTQLKGGDHGHKSWSTPAYTFPLLMRALDIDDFFEDIISGLVISVGGLTESVMKNSTKALLNWCRRASSRTNETPLISKLGNGTCQSVG